MNFLSRIQAFKDETLGANIEDALLLAIRKEHTRFLLRIKKAKFKTPAISAKMRKVERLLTEVGKELVLPSIN